MMSYRWEMEYPLAFVGQGVGWAALVVFVILVGVASLFDPEIVE